MNYSGDFNRRGGSENTSRSSYQTMTCDTNYQSQLGARQMAEMYTRRPTTEVITGIVTQIQGTFGMISHEIFFQLSNVVGLVPKLGDKVVVEAEPVVIMPFKFNSTRVQIISKDMTSAVPTSPRMKAPPPPILSQFRRTSKFEEQVNNRINRFKIDSPVSADLKTAFRERELQRKKLDELYPEMTFVNQSVSPKGKEGTSSKTSKNKERRPPLVNRGDLYRRRLSQKIRSKSIKRHIKKGRDSKTSSRTSSNRSKSPLERRFRDPVRHCPSSSPQGNRKRLYRSPILRSKRASPSPPADRRSKRQKMRNSPSPPAKRTERRSRLSDWLSIASKKRESNISEKSAKHRRSSSPSGSPSHRSPSSVKLLKCHSQKTAKPHRSSPTVISDQRRSNESQKTKIESTKKETKTKQTSSPIVPRPEISSEQLPIQIPGPETPKGNQNDLKIPNLELELAHKIKNMGVLKCNPELQCINCLRKGHPAFKCPYPKDYKANKVFMNKQTRNRQRQNRKNAAKLRKQLQDKHAK